MKAYFILCVLLASILFFPFSLLARELASTGGESADGTVVPAAGSRDRPGLPCGHGGKGNPYKCPIVKPPKCRYKRCPPNSSP